MAEEIRVVEHYSASIANTVGEGARVLGALRDGGVNLIAFWGYKHGAGRAQLEFIPARHSALHKRRVRALIPQSVRFPTRQETLFANGQRALGRSQSSSWIPPFVPRRRVSRPSHPRCARSWSRGSVDGNPIGPMVWTCLRWSLVRAAGRGSTIHCQCFR